MRLVLPWLHQFHLVLQLPNNLVNPNKGNQSFFKRKLEDLILIRSSCELSPRLPWGLLAHFDLVLLAFPGQKCYTCINNFFFYKIQHSYHFILVLLIQYISIYNYCEMHSVNNLIKYVTQIYNSIIYTYFYYIVFYNKILKFALNNVEKISLCN